MADSDGMTGFAACRDALRPHYVAGLETRRLPSAAFWQAVASDLDRGPFEIEEIGRSLQDRPLRAIGYGTGKTPVLLWSQMHGDETTATRALADVLAFLAAGDHPLARRLGERLRIIMVPILNPDGAEVHQRENAAGVDLNRDAGRGVSPEARALEAIRERHRPEFGFNLHDQDVRRRAGPEGDQVAIALLAPPAGPERDWPPARDRARRLAAVMALGLGGALPRRVARWTDDFDRRAFGEYMQAAGTSTVLVEAGALPDDPEKDRLRGYYGALLLEGLDTIATERWNGADPGPYNGLPLNHGVDHDVHLVGGTAVVEGREFRADVALLFDDPVARTGTCLAELGDLGGATALEVVDATGRRVTLTAEHGRSPGMLAPGDRVVVDVGGAPDTPA